MGRKPICNEFSFLCFVCKITQTNFFVAQSHAQQRSGDDLRRITCVPVGSSHKRASVALLTLEIGPRRCPAAASSRMESGRSEQTCDRPPTSPQSSGNAIDSEAVRVPLLVSDRFRLSTQ